MSTAAVIDLNARRPKVYEQMYCMFCGTHHALVHPVPTKALQYFGPCQGCDEEASVPVSMVVTR